MKKNILNEIRFHTTLAIVILVLFSFFISFTTLTELIPRLQAAEDQNIILSESLKNSINEIKLLKYKIESIEETHKHDLQNQLEWNQLRSNASNENLHLMIEEIVNKYLESGDER